MKVTIFAAFYFGGANDDEVMTRHTIHGICKSPRCAGNKRTATRTTFRDKTVITRCDTCKSDNHFTETADEYNDTGHFNGREWEQEERRRSNFEQDTPNKRGRKDRRR